EIRQPPVVSSIELRAAYRILRGFGGEPRENHITAIARNTAGISVPGVKINWGIREPAPYKGIISPVPGDSLTNENGQAQVRYNVVLERDADVVIYAGCGGLTAETVIQLRIVEVIGGIELSAERNILVVPPGQTRQTLVTAMVVDTSGLALPGMLVRFRTQPAFYGILDSDAAFTDVQGRAVEEFHSIVNRYGLCTVFAQVGEFADSTVIEIREE
ncbi:MAG: hypothetical protein V2A61_04530, partial [Calditrichota bacterium]